MRLIKQNKPNMRLDDNDADDVNDDGRDEIAEHTGRNEPKRDGGGLGEDQTSPTVYLTVLRTKGRNQPN